MNERVIVLSQVAYTELADQIPVEDQWIVDETSEHPAGISLWTMTQLRGEFKRLTVTFRKD